MGYDLAYSSGSDFHGTNGDFRDGKAHWTPTWSFPATAAHLRPDALRTQGSNRAGTTANATGPSRRGTTCRRAASELGRPVHQGIRPRRSKPAAAAPVLLELSLAPSV